MKDAILKSNCFTSSSFLSFSASFHAILLWSPKKEAAQDPRPFSEWKLLSRRWASKGLSKLQLFVFLFFYGNLSQKKIVFQYLCGCFLCLSSILDFRCTVGPLSSWMQLSLQLAQSGKHRLSRKWLIYASVICNLSRVEHSWTLGISLACMA